MKPTPIWFDESGFTGKNLLDRDQPFFSMASTIIDNDEAESLLRHCFPAFQGNEYKSLSIWKRKSGKEGLLKLSEALKRRHEDCFVVNVDKHFWLLSGISCDLIAPYFEERGLDFYKQRYSQRFTNQAFSYLHVHGSRQLYIDVISNWYTFSRDPSGDNLEKLALFFSEQIDNCKTELHFFFDACLRGIDNIGKDIDSMDNEYFQDRIHLHTMTDSLLHWRKIKGDDLSLIYDESNDFLKDKEFWESLTSKDNPSRSVQTNAGDSSFPIRIASSRPEDSKLSSSIQLCDVIAGTYSRIARSCYSVFSEFEHEREFSERLLDSGFEGLKQNNIMPGPGMVAGPPPKKDGQDLSDVVFDVLMAGRN